LEGNSDTTYVQQMPSQTPFQQALAPQPVAPVASAPVAVEEDSKFITIKSPIIGTFYRKPLLIRLCL
jgi:acetyl-CoA carboxylase biotin carboxyl carrier protein